MVYVKVTAGPETRKLQVDEGITFDQLKEKVARTFPALDDGKTEFELRYQDADGDLIHISSDAEVATALSHLPPDSVWRLLVVAKTAATQPGRRRQPRQLSSMMPYGPSGLFGGFGPRFDTHWDSLLGEMTTDPFWSPVGLFSWGADREQRTREFENYMQQRERQFEEEMQHVRQMQDDHMRQFEEQRRKAEESVRRSLNAPPVVPGGSGEQPPPAAQAPEPQQGQQQQQQQVVSGGGGGGGAVASGQPKWHCQTFGSWEPTTYKSAHGRRTVIGPVGYHMYWGYSDPEPMDAQPEQQEEEGEGEKPTDA